ncbi:MAG: HEAT repeat domain-containing protein [Polyangiales bacterium]
MGLFDVFTGGGGLKKHLARVANKRTQQHERWESIQALADDGSEEALRGLLTRFTVRVDPSITDGEEKNATFLGIVKHGRAAVGPVREFLETGDTLAWPLKILREIQGEEEVTTALLELLEKMDTGYERDPQKKIDAIASLEDTKDARTVGAVTRFLEDMNETVRFHATSAIFSQDEAQGAIGELTDAFLREESVRVRMIILDGFMEREWKLAGPRDQLQKKLPAGYSLGKKGEVRKKAGL